MFVYIALAVVIGIFALQEDGERTSQVTTRFYISLFLFLLVVGLRYMHGDYRSYLMGYNTGIDVGGDPGYYELQLFFSRQGVSFQFFVFILTLVSVFALRQTFRMNFWPNIGFTIILGKIFTLYAMSGIRQYLAMVVCWWAISELLIYKRKYVFLIMVLLAYTLHGSAIIILPVYFFRKRKFTFFTACIIMIIAIIGGSFSMSFFSQASGMNDFIDERFAGYVYESRIGGEAMNALNYVENFLFLFLAIKIRNRIISKVPYYDFFLYMFVIYCGFLVAGSDVGIVKRLRDYYALSYIFIIPSFIYFFSRKSLRKLSQCMIISYFIFLMFRSLIVYDRPLSIGSYGRMIPYHSIFQIK
jgi:membrane protein